MKIQYFAFLIVLLLIIAVAALLYLLPGENAGPGPGGTPATVKFTSASSVFADSVTFTYTPDAAGKSDYIVDYEILRDGIKIESSVGKVYEGISADNPISIEVVREGDSTYESRTLVRKADGKALYNGTMVVNRKPTGEDFCGRSTKGGCSSDSECAVGGCTLQVCQSVHEEPVSTTCEWRECYNPELYGLGCKCIASQCQWSG